MQAITENTDVMFQIEKNRFGDIGATFSRAGSIVSQSRSYTRA